MLLLPCADRSTWSIAVWTWHATTDAWAGLQFDFAAATTTTALIAPCSIICSVCHGLEAAGVSCAAGNVPPMADLGQLQGLEARVQTGQSESPMIDGKKWDGAKAYKDSKVCNMLTMGELHRWAATSCYDSSHG